jgi:hypothetical protein
LVSSFIHIFFGLFSLASEIKAQSEAKVTKIVKNYSNDFITWFNTGEIDTLIKLFRDEKCLVARGCGKSFIKRYYDAESMKYKFIELSVINVSVSDAIAVEKGKWKILLKSEEEVGGEFLTEWRITDKNWLMVNDIGALYEN